MASEKDATCENDPNFAIICAFFEKFSTMLNIQPPEIKRLQEWLENTDEVFPGLKELHIKLMRKLRKTVHQTAWETALAKFCYTYSSQDAWEIERFGYKKSSLKVKLRILKELVESQFQRNGKFRNNFGNLSADELRSQPIGRDQLGHSYWLTRDKECNLRIYQEHLDEEIWQVVASSRDELVTLISRLKGNEVVLPSLVGVADEDSSSNSCVEPIVKPPPPEEQDSPDEKADGTNKSAAPNIKIKLDTSKITSEKINGNTKRKEDEKSENDNALSEEMEEEEEEEGEEEAEEEEEEEGEEEEDEEEEEDDEEEEKIDSKPSADKNNKDKKEVLISTKNESKDEQKSIAKPASDSEKAASDIEKMVVGEPEKVEIKGPEKMAIDESEEIVDRESKKKAVSEPKKDAVSEPKKESVSEPKKEAVSEPGEIVVSESDKVVDNESKDQAVSESEEAAVSEHEEMIVSESEELMSESEDQATSEPEKNVACEPENPDASEPVKVTIVEPEKEIRKRGEPESDKQVIIKSEKDVAMDSEKEGIKSEKACNVSEDVASEPEKKVVTEPDKKDIDEVAVAESEENIEPKKEVATKIDTNVCEIAEKSENIADEPENIADEPEKVVSEHEEPVIKGGANGKENDVGNSGSSNDKSKVTSPPRETAANGDKNPKKRPLDEIDKQDNIDMENITKKSRPTLLAVNREKKISKYEKYGEELDEEEENEEAEEEGSEEDDEEEDDGSGEDEIGDEIVEEVMVIKCSGSGKDCESGYINSIDFGCEESEFIVSEAIEEETFYVVGEGSGKQCLVGNTKEKSSEGTTLRIKETNCLKSDSVKQKESKLPENDNNCLDNKDNGTKVNCVEDKETDICRNKVRNGENLDNTKDKSNESDTVKETTIPNDVDSENKITENDLDTKKEFGSKTNKNISSGSSSDKKNIDENDVEGNSEYNSDSSIEKPKINEKIIKVVEKKEPKSSYSNRKRRLAEDSKRISESETDLNSEQIEESTETENDIGGKRLKMRSKVVNLDIRNKVEEKRNKENEEGSSSDDENSQERELEKISNSKIDDKCTEVETKECVSEPPKLPTEDQPASNSAKNSTKDIKTSQIKEEKESAIMEIVCNSSKNEAIPPADADISTKEKDKSDDEAKPEIIMQIKTRSGRKMSLEPATPSKRKGKAAPVAAQKSNGKNKKAKNATNTPEKPVAEVNVEADEKVEIIPETTTTAKQETDEEAEKPAKSRSPSPEIAKVEKEENKEPVKKKQRRTKIEIDTSNIIEADSDITPVRQSRRIAQLKIREEAERRKLEEVALKKMKQELKRKKKEEKKNLSDPTVVELSEPSDKDSDVNSEAEMKKKLEKKKRGVKKGGWSSGSEEDEEEEEVEYEEVEYDPGSPLFKSDHEFSPESEVEDESEAVPTKRARTAGKEGEPIEGVDHEACQKCGKKDHPQWILLCDKCNKGYHCSCLSPVLFIIPEGDWFCPPCQQEQLIEALEVELNSYDLLVAKQKAEVEQQNAAIAEEAAAALAESQPKIVETKPMKLLKSGKQPRRKYIKRKEPEANKGNGGKGKSISNGESDDDEKSSNSSSSSSRSNSSSSASSSSNTDSEDEPIYKLRKRRQINVSYRFHEYDDLINSAIKREMDEVAGAGNLGRGKDISTIIEADKEEKMRQKQLEAQKDQPDLNESCSKEQPPNPNPLDITTVVQEEPLLEKIASPKTKEDSGSDFEPVKVKPKFINRKNLKKKNRKLNSLDISSEDDGSDEDFKTSSYETEEDEEDISAPSDSDSSLEIYKRKSKKNKKSKRSTRRAARARKKRYEDDDDFIVQDSDGSDFPKIKKKRKIDSEYTESETDDDDISEDVDSDELCDDSTDSDESDGAWKPSSKRKQKKAQKKKLSKKSSNKKNRRKSDDGRAFKGSYSKKKIFDDDDSDDDSLDSGRRTRGKRFTYLEDYEDESSDDGIKPGVKRPDTPPEEREKFIRRQEEIKRMLAEKNTEAAKAAATPTLIPISKANKAEGVYDPSASISTVPLSVIKGAKALDIDYLQRKGELESDDPETDFDDDLPDDFNPEDMDEEEIAKMMEEEDFAQQQLKLAGESIQKKKTKDVDTFVSRPEYEPVRVPRFVAPIQDPNRKKLPIPTIYPIIGNHPFNKVINNPANYARLPTPPHRLLMQQVHRPPHHMNTARTQLAQSILSKPNSATAPHHSVGPSPPSSQTLSSPSNAHEPQKPRGRRKKITPLRDPLQKQQAAAAAAAAAAAVNPPQGQSSKESSPVVDKPPPPASAQNLSVAQPPQLYKPPSNTQPSVITRMPQPPRPRFTDQSARFYPPGQLGHRPPPPRLSSLPMPPHHVLRPSYVGGPPPLRPSGTGPPVSLGNSIARHSLTRQPPPFGNTDQFPPRPRHSNPLNPYRPPLYGTPGYPPAPPGPPPGPSPQTPARTPPQTPPGPPPPQLPSNLHSGATDYSVSTYTAPPYGTYYPPPMGTTHSTPPPPTATAVPSSVIVTAAANTTPSPTPAIAEPVPPQPTGPKATPLETFDSKSTPPLETESTRSPYSAATPPEEREEGPDGAATNSTSEFSGLVSYFSSQQDDLNT